MTSLFNRLFGLRKSSGAAPSTRLPGHADAQVSRFSESPTTIEDNSEIGMRSQLIHVLLRDALRRYGMPAQWIECQILQVSSRRLGNGMFVRLIVKHWDERLMQHLMAFEKAYLTDLKRFEPNASQWLHGISWQIQPLNACPYTTMPDKTFWQNAPSAHPLKAQASAPALAAAVGGADKPAFEATRPILEDERDQALSDIQRLFAIRDQEIAQSSKNSGHSDYPPTEPSPLRQ